MRIEVEIPKEFEKHFNIKEELFGSGKECVPSVEDLERFADGKVVKWKHNKEDELHEKEIRTNADRIRAMSDEELNKFLWWFKIDTVARFFENGPQGCTHALEQMELLKSEDSSWIEKLMSMGDD